MSLDPKGRSAGSLMIFGSGGATGGSSARPPVSGAPAPPPEPQPVPEPENPEAVVAPPGAAPSQEAAPPMGGVSPALPGGLPGMSTPPPLPDAGAPPSPLYPEPRPLTLTLLWNDRVR
jgi:hypothetical protein